MAETSDPTQTYLENLLVNNLEALQALFAGEPSINDPMIGAVWGSAALAQFASERHSWLTERAAQITPLRITHKDRRSVFEALLQLQLQEHIVELPIAVVGDLASNGKLQAVRVYHSMWPLLGTHRVRQALLTKDPTLKLSDTIVDYQKALAEGDVDAIVKTFEPDGYFREPAGGGYIYKGLDEVRKFMGEILGTGGIGLEHCTATDDGVACAIEFNAVTFGPEPLIPQAGVAVYERGPSGKLHAARIYDDVNVEALANPGKQSSKT